MGVSVRVLRFLLKGWCQFWCPRADSSTEIDVHRWSEQIQNVNRTSSKQR